MKRIFYLFFAFVFGLSISSLSWAAKTAQLPQGVSFTRRGPILAFAIEGLTGDATGNLYTTGRQPDTTKKCPVWRISPSGAKVTVAFIPNNPACNPSGITFDTIGNLYIADAAAGGNIRTVSPDPIGCASDDSSDPSCSSLPTSTNYATGVPGTNGLAFDASGNLWTGDGTTGQGRVWKIAPGGGACEPTFTGCEEAFRVQPMAATNLEIGLAFGAGQTFGSGVTAVGRDARSLPTGTIDANRAATNTLASQPLVANGVAFNRNGDLFILDTARGAIWKVEFNEDGSLRSKTGCDEVFPSNTLCLTDILVAHPLLEGADGFFLDQAGNFWVDANERNAVVVYTTSKQIVEIFRSPPDPTTHLRNNGPLEFPTSPFISGKTFCTSNSDGNRRDNSPNSAGEINSGGAVGTRGKIECMDQDLKIPGMPLPVQ